ncbi:MAG: ice-binding family protein [Lentisphaerae bacterium]|nr:ice-binding family protein [Lentisphaerota bacterium]
MFQIASKLVVGADGRSVILAGGAHAKNIFWQVGTAATLGTFSSFQGTIMADQSIVMDTSSTMVGRALAFEAGVTFNGTGGSLPLSSQVITNFMPTNGSTFVGADVVGLSAQASSGLPVSFAVVIGDPGLITGGTNLSFASTGMVRVVASQAGNESFSPAPNVTNTYTVTPPLATDPGWLAVDVTPNTGKWQLTTPAAYTGPTAGTGDLAAVSAVVGEYTIAYGPLSGYVKPANETQFVVAGVTSLFSGVYLQVDTNIAPPVLSATEGTYTNKVRVTWSSVPGVDGYEIWKSLRNDVDTAELLVAVPDYGAATFLYDDYDVIPPLAYYYWGLSKQGTKSSPFSLVDMGYASLAPDPDAPRADITVSDMVYLPVNATNMTTAGTVSFRLRNLGPDAMNAAKVAFAFRIGANDAGMVVLGAGQRTFTLAAGQEELVILTAEDRLDLVIPPFLAGRKQVQVTVRHASPLIDPNPANNTTTAVGSVLVRAAGVNSPGRTRTDFDGDGKTDPTVLSDARTWFVRIESGDRYTHQTVVVTGVAGDRYQPALGDYDGDGITDLGLYDEATGIFYAQLSSSGVIVSAPAAFGGVGYIPVVGDYDGDGKSDPALYDQNTGHLVVRLSAQGYAEAATILHGPHSHYIPVQGDYDGDGLTDPAAFSMTSGLMTVRLSSQNYTEYELLLGGAGFVGLRGDFDGDGMADPAAYHEASGTWVMLLSDYGRGFIPKQGVFGGPGWMVVPNDYDGDGRTDPALYNADVWNPLGWYEGYWIGMLSSLDYAEVEGWFAGPGHEQVTE